MRTPAYSIAHPPHTQQALQEILAAPSLQRLLNDPDLGKIYSAVMRRKLGLTKRIRLLC